MGTGSGRRASRVLPPPVGSGTAVSALMQSEGRRPSWHRGALSSSILPLQNLRFVEC